MKRLFAYTALLLATAACNRLASPEQELRDFIRSSWEQSVRTNTQDDDTLLGLPHPYTVPSVSGMFQEMYYWDTFFTNEGLLADGLTEQARNNTDNLLAMVERFGFVPNGSRTWYLNRSQPPYLCMMADRVWQHTGDTQWLQKAFPLLVREYRFWMTERMTPAGLNRYSSSADDELLREFVATGSRRLNHDFTADTPDDRSLAALGRHFAAEAESGWDFNPRFERRCEDFCPIDLNANLCIYEQTFARWSELFGDSDAAQMWSERARNRRDIINRLCKGDDGLYYDYDYVNDRRSEVISAALFNLLWAGIPDEQSAQQLADKALAALEFEYGIAACADTPCGYDYQWSYPNAWAPLTWLAVKGLETNRRPGDARRIARKYIRAMTGIYQHTGNLWEKYNVRTGSTDVNNEYEMPQMLGWSAGVFVCLDEWLGNNTKL